MRITPGDDLASMQARKVNPVQRNCIESEQPAFTSPTADLGGGTMGWELLLAIPLLLLARIRKLVGQ